MSAQFRQERRHASWAMAPELIYAKPVWDEAVALIEEG